MKAWQQGHADGLCGIYSVLHFLQRTEWEEADPSDGLRYLLDAAQSLGWLTPHYLTKGFEDHQLKAILDLQLERYRLSHKTFFMDEVVTSKGFDSFSQIVNAVVAKRGSLIAHHDAREHWLLIAGNNKRAIAVDSANSDRPIDDYNSRIRSFSLTHGLVILPIKRPHVEIDL